jgi:hypothetical protein
MHEYVLLIAALAKLLLGTAALIRAIRKDS